MNPTLTQELYVWKRTPAGPPPSERQRFTNFTRVIREWNNARLYSRRHQLLHRTSPIFPRDLVSHLNAIDNEIVRRKRAGLLRSRKDPR